LVVCDDGSSDGTLSIVRAFAANATFPVHVHVNDVNLGFNRNFLNGALLCGSELIAFCDQDDIWKPGKLDECVRMFMNDDIVLTVHAAEVVDKDLQPLGYAIQDYGSTRVVGSLKGDPFFRPRGFSLVCRPRLLRLVPFDKRPRNLEGQLQDFDEWIGFLANIFGRTAYLRSRLVLYRQHDWSVTPVAASHKVFSSIRRSLNAGPNAYNFRVQLALEYVSLLKELAEASTGDERKSLTRAASFYRVLSQRWERRTALYKSRPLPAVWLPRAIVLLLRGDYGTSMGGKLDWRALAKDLCVALTGYRPSG
jgi:glycosyltransferase involved in cell wall biosynthesis